MTSVFQQLNADLANMIAGVQRSVVQIVNESGGAGAGTIWHSDGLILTNAHVVRHDRVSVALPDGRTLPAQTVAIDPERDLAALAVSAHGLPTIQPGSSKRLLPGQWVTAVGHPWGIANAATGGVVIGVGKPLPQMNSRQPDWVIVDLKLRPGNSGGPLVDVYGRIVGVNTIMTGILGGAAVSVDAAKRFLRSYLGDAPAPQPSQTEPASEYV